MSEEAEDQDARYQLTPRMVVERTMRQPFKASDVLADLREFASLGIEPGEVGVIVFPREGEAFFEVADAASGDDGALAKLRERLAIAETRVGVLEVNNDTLAARLAEALRERVITGEATYPPMRIEDVNGAEAGAQRGGA